MGKLEIYSEIWAELREEDETRGIDAIVVIYIYTELNNACVRDQSKKAKGLGENN